MLSEIASTTVVALFALSLVVLYFVQPADDALAAELLLGDGRQEEGWLPPIFRGLLRIVGTTATRAGGHLENEEDWRPRNQGCISI
ncbi:hypothetical protein MTO96_048793 [Rhipicephalus appendiculatus]